MLSKYQGAYNIFTFCFFLLFNVYLVFLVFFKQFDSSDKLPNLRIKYGTYIFEYLAVLIMILLTIISGYFAFAKGTKEIKFFWMLLGLKKNKS
tara:strand:+ start:3997 stop:4275 length:279 start_codon:yes stop_codon:yes gene_type:complete